MALCLEVCAESARASEAAELGGAQRVELCRDLSVDGLTPSVGLMQEARRVCGLPLFAMIRPRAGDFRYGSADLRAMEAAIGDARTAGMDGIVLGALRADGGVDARAIEHLVRGCGELPVTFHRAFDRTPDPLAALEELVELGVSRVLTSGGAPSALAGADALARLVERAGERIVVLVAGGVRAGNVAELVRRTGAKEFHSSLGGEEELTAGGVRELAERLSIK